MSSAKKTNNHFNALVRHPVQIEKIPHIVVAVTLFYMFGFLFIALGFAISQSSQVTAIEVNPVEVAPSNLQQDFEPYYFEEEYNQEGVLGEQDLEYVQPINNDTNEVYPQVEQYPVEYEDPYLEEEYLNEEDYYYNDDSYLNEDYVDEDYYNYWGDDSGNFYYGDAQPIDSPTADVYVATPAKSTFTSRLSTTASNESLMFVGFSVLAMGILVFVVNHIHENNHFSHKSHNKISKNK